MGLYKVKFANPVHTIEVTAANSTEALLRALKAQSPQVSKERAGGKCCYGLDGFIDSLIAIEHNRSKREVCGED